MKKITAIVQIIWLPAFLIVFNCSEKKNPFGLKELSKTNIGEVKHLVKRGTQKETSMIWPNTDVTTSDELIIGSYKNNESAILLKFGNLIDSVNVKDVSLIMSPIYRITGSDPQPTDVSIHQVTMSWTEEDITPLNILDHYEQNALTNGVLPDTLTEIDTLDFDIDITQGWIDQDIPNNGVLLFADNANQISVYESDETSRAPKLKIIYEKEGTTDSTNIPASEATSVLQTDFQLSSDRLVVGSGLGYVSFFRLSVTEIPQYATINKAYLNFTVDTLQTIFQEGRQFNLSRLEHTTLEWETHPTLADSSIRYTSSYFGGSTFQIEVTPFLQNWVNQQEENNGVRLAPLSPAEGIYRLVMYSSAVQDSTLHPEFEVFYTMPPESDR